MERGFWFGVVLVLASVLAGCLGGDEVDPENGEENENGDDGQETDDRGDESAARLRFEGGYANASADFEGSFEPHATCPGVGCFTGDSFQAIDITDLVPEGQVVSVSAHLTHDTGSAGMLHGDFYMAFWLESDDATVYLYDWRNPEPGTLTLDSVIVRNGGEVRIGLQAVFPPVDTDVNLDYELAVETTAHVEDIPPTIPLAVPLEEGQELLIETVDGGEAEVLIYAPDDTLLERMTVSGDAAFTPEDNETGAFVVFGAAGSQAINLAVTPAREDSPGPLEPLGFEWTMGDNREVGPTGETQWIFEVDDHPLRAGIFVFSTDNWAGVQGFTTELDLPDGSTIEGRAECGVCMSVGGAGSFQAGVSTALGDEGLEPGEYTATVTADAAYVGFQAHEYTVRYAR